MIRYLYTGSLPPDMDQCQILQLMVTADTYSCRSCLKQCQHELLNAFDGLFGFPAMSFLFDLPSALYEHPTAPLYAIKQAMEK